MSQTEMINNASEAAMDHRTSGSPSQVHFMPLNGNEEDKMNESQSLIMPADASITTLSQFKSKVDKMAAKYISNRVESAIVTKKESTSPEPQMEEKEDDQDEVTSRLTTEVKNH